MKKFDVIVLGAGGVGSAALFHLAARGVKALGIDRFPVGHARGSSHGLTRIIRQAYFEHPSYVPMVLRSYDLWRELEARRGEQLLFPVGIVEIGLPTSEVIAGVRRSAREYNIAIEEWSPAEAAKRLPGFNIPPGMDVVFEPTAGYLLVEKCVIAHAEEAIKLGAELRTDEAVVGWKASGGGVIVETERERYAADRLVIAAGPWASQSLADLNIPLTVLRKPLYWWRTTNDLFRADRGCPPFLCDLPWGCFYGFPQIDELGVKTAEHSGGRPITDPTNVDRELDEADQARMMKFTREMFPTLTTECTLHKTCMYTMTPDGNFVVDRHPQAPQVVFAAGLSGHGFKFTPMLGEALAELALDGKTTAPIEFLSLGREALRSEA